MHVLGKKCFGLNGQNWPGSWTENFSKNFDSLIFFQFLKICIFWGVLGNFLCWSKCAKTFTVVGQKNFQIVFVKIFFFKYPVSCRGTHDTFTCFIRNPLHWLEPGGSLRISFFSIVLLNNSLIVIYCYWYQIWAWGSLYKWFLIKKRCKKFP